MKPRARLSNLDPDLLTSVFEERAENLSKENLEAWTAETPRDRALLAKLRGTGAKLLIGPRGSGKSTLLRKAYFALLDEGKHLAAYVNYSRSLALEPLFHKQANALAIFRQWVLYNIVRAVARVVSRNHKCPETLKMYGEIALDYIKKLEIGEMSGLPSHPLAPSELLILLENWTADLGFTRCILLLDDAAHAFSEQQQREFFEIFRNMRSHRVAPKAAVYPGITSYSPFFHVGHEAELLEAWYEPQDPTYIKTMREVARLRLPPEIYSAFEGRQQIIDYLALAAFGLPRGFLNMVSYVLGVEEDAAGASPPNRRKAEKAVFLHAESVRNIFRTLQAQFPRFSNFVQIGSELERAMAKTLRDFNRNKSAGAKKAVAVGIAEPIGQELQRILAMAEYAGLLRRIGQVSRGVKGVFQRYALHYALVLVENSLSLGKSYLLKDAISSLAQQHAHAFARSHASSLLGVGFESRCMLNLTPCQKCGAPRLSEQARFCMKCGEALKDISIYEELIKSPISSLPLTSNKIDGLLQRTSLRTVQDILLDEECREIRKVPYVGPVWSARIRNAAQEYVSV